MTDYPVLSLEAENERAVNSQQYRPSGAVVRGEASLCSAPVVSRPDGNDGLVPVWTTTHPTFPVRSSWPFPAITRLPNVECIHQLKEQLLNKFITVHSSSSRTVRIKKIFLIFKLGPTL